MKLISGQLYPIIDTQRCFVMFRPMPRKVYCCKQCGYRWMTRWGQRPDRCANKVCLSARWDELKVDGPKRRGRPPKNR